MINKVILVGNVGADPEIRTLENGTKVARVRLATTERIYNRTTQETKEHTEWHTVVLWRGLADVADKYVRKGSQIYVEGSLRSNEWTDKEGGKRYGVEIVANDMKLLGRRGDGASGSGGGSSTGGYGVGSGGGSNYGSGGTNGGFNGGGGNGGSGNGNGNGGFNGASGSQGSAGGAGSSHSAAPHNPDPIPVDDPDDLPF